MKANRLVCFLLTIVIQLSPNLHAQQREPDARLVNELRAKAESGDASAQVGLGDALRFGNLGMAKDETEAVKWYRKAADQNDAQAQLTLGICYEGGQGVTGDAVEAAKWYRKAANQNVALAQFNLAVCYARGEGVPKNEGEAVEWYRKAANQNYAEAQGNLGLCYAQGQGVARDDLEAVKWLRKAAEQNQARGQYNLGYCYTQGQGVVKDDSEAVRWFRKAAEQNDAPAQFNLGLCYARGQGVAKDEVEAYKWWLLAVAKSDENARKHLHLLESKLTMEQMAEGKRLAGSFVPDHVSEQNTNSTRQTTLPSKDVPQGKAATIEQRAIPRAGKKLTPEQERMVVQQHGLNPDEYELDPTATMLIPKEKPKAEQSPPTPIKLPSEVRYVIQVANPRGSDTTYYSKTEPKPYGNGFKFEMWPGDVEITVSGSVRIVKLKR